MLVDSPHPSLQYLDEAWPSNQSFSVEPLKLTSTFPLLETPGKMPKVLAVDDDCDSLILLQQILTQFQCQVICKSQGLEALHWAKLRQPDLILLDIRLQDIDGFEIVRKLKQHVKTMTIPIVAVTALASQTDRQQLLNAGCNHYISKPYLLEEIEGLLTRYLQLKDI
ncbi:MAG: response regulator [Leptolyngbyaceae cyanobacterium]